VPQGYWYCGPFGVLGEYAISSQLVERDAKGTNGSSSIVQPIRNEGWEVSATYVLTGEENTFQGIKPRAPFSPANGGCGAWELAARVGQLSIDQSLFPSFAASGSARKASSWGTGVNWYPNRNIKLSLDYEQTYFKGGASQPGNVTAQDEKIIFSRVKLAF